MWFFYPNTKGEPILRIAKDVGGELSVGLEKCGILLNRLVRYTQHLLESLEAMKNNTLTEEEKQIYTMVAIHKPWLLKYRPGDVMVIEGRHISSIPK